MQSERMAFRKSDSGRIRPHVLPRSFTNSIGNIDSCVYICGDDEDTVEVGTCSNYDIV